MCSRGDSSWLAEMEGLKELPAGLLAARTSVPRAQSEQGSWGGVAEPRAAPGVPAVPAGFAVLPPHCASVLKHIVGCMGGASYWEEGIAGPQKAKGSLV